MKHPSVLSLESIESHTACALPTVFVVDDDVSIRESLGLLIRCAGWKPAIFASAEEFLERPRNRGPSCLVLDVNLPNLSGLDLQRRLAADRIDMPIIFVTGHSDVSMAVEAMKAGAVEFLSKPLREDEVLSAIGRSIEHSRAALDREVEAQVLRDRYASLSRREREVMELVIRGRLNKQIGANLGIGESTVKAHRGRLMQKMKAGSLVDLVYMAAELRLAAPRPDDASRRLQALPPMPKKL
jgi:FixJ family two-component response regulator